MSLSNSPEPKRPSRSTNLTYASIAGFAGCWITFFVIGSLFLGLWIDAQLGLRGPFTVGLVVISVPITLYIVVRIVLALVSHIQPPPTKKQARDSATEEDNL